MGVEWEWRERRFECVREGIEDWRDGGDGKVLKGYRQHRRAER